MAFGMNPLTGRPGPTPKPPRDGDREQARQRINVEVRTGRRPHPNEFPCVDCGHEWREGERRHEYDHHRGYAPAHHLDVEVVCTLCHARRDSAKKRQTHCKQGHEFTPENTGFKSNGTRHRRARIPSGCGYPSHEADHEDNQHDVESVFDAARALLLDSLWGSHFLSHGHGTSKVSMISIARRRIRSANSARTPAMT